jgi:hypothetical protein
VVKSIFVDNPMRGIDKKPISVLAALVAGFESVASKPVLILPILALDLILWLGPRLGITTLIPEGIAWLGLPAASDPLLVEEIRVIEQVLAVFRERYNILSALSVFPAGMPFNMLIASGSLPAGLPSLMAGRFPAVTPLGAPIVHLIGNPLAAAAIWLGVTIVGLGLGTSYHRLLAWQTMPGVELGPGWKSWWRMLILYALAYCGGMVILTVSALIASFASLFIPLLGALILFAGMSALFWTAVYFAFTAHGIVGYQFGVIEAILESVHIVRANLLSTVGFLFSAFAITWFTTLEIWTLPGDASWYNLLAFIGFAFISTTLLAASYVFYKERRIWFAELRASLVMKPSEGHEPPGTKA